MKLMNSPRPVLLALVASTTLVLASAALPATLQDSGGDPTQHKDHEKHMKDKASAPSLEQQIAELRMSVARLEVALEMNHKGKSQAPDMQLMQAGGMQGMGMGGMAKKDMGSMDSAGMGAMGGKAMGGMSKGMGMGKMGGMKMGSMGGAKMGMGSMGMGGMKKMGDMPAMGMAISALPGFPGASHLYHIGATGFFLDHTDHIVLSKEQLTQISKARETAMLGQATSQRKIDQAEQELWELTGADEPDVSKIDAKVREIEKLRGDQRIAFIRSIGESAKLLTGGQRKQLAGMLPPGPSAGADPSMGGMR